MVSKKTTPHTQPTRPLHPRVAEDPNFGRALQLWGQPKAKPRSDFLVEGAVSPFFLGGGGGGGWIFVEAARFFFGVAKMCE